MTNDLATSLEESRSIAVEEAPANTLVTLENVGELDPMVIFKAGGIKPILEAIEKEVLSIVPDLSTDKSRKAIASLARKVSTSKVAIKNIKDAFTEERKAELKIIMSEGKIAEAGFDAIRDKARSPLTIWENDKKTAEAAEAARLKAEKLAEEKENDHEFALMMADKFDRDLKDAQEEAAKIAKEAHERELEIEAKRIKRFEEEAAEAARIEAEAKAKAEIERVEREKRELVEREQIAKDQAEQAKRSRIAAEERAKVQAENAEIARLEAVKQAAIDAEAAAERSRVQAEQAEAARLEAVKQACIDRVFAADKAKADEIARQEAENASAELKKAERLADRQHVSKFRGESKEALMFWGLTEEAAKRVVMAIHDCKIPHVKITY